MVTVSRGSVGLLYSNVQHSRCKIAAMPAVAGQVEPIPILKKTPILLEIVQRHTKTTVLGYL